jgi:ribosomal protein L21E
MEITVGTRVVVIDREQLPADIKSGLFYPHYSGLTGEVLKVYGQECAVLVDRKALPTAIYERHQQNEKQQRQRWLDGLSEDARSKLSAKEKELVLNDAILVSLSDLSISADGGESRILRASATDLDAAEEAFLSERGDAVTE